MDFLSLVAKLTLDSSAYENGLSKAKGLATSIGGGIATGLKVAGAAIATATTAVTGFAAASVKTGSEFDKSMSQVAATMGLSMDEMKDQVGEVDLAWGTFSGNLREYAQEMGKNTAFSAKESADALNYMALAGYDVTESMQMLPNVLNLAAAGNMDLARASDMVTDAQTAFGLEIEDMPQLIDEMAKASSTGNTSVEQLGDAFLTVGGLAKELNGGLVTLADGTTKPTSGIQELEIALTAMANAGIKGGEAGTHMRNMLLKLADPTDDGIAAMEQYGISVFDASGKMRSMGEIMSSLSDVLGTLSQEEKIGVISDLFNTRDLASAEALMGAFGDKAGMLATKLRDASYDGEALAIAYGKLTGETYDADTAISELANSIVRMNTWGYDNDQMLHNLQSDFGLTAEEAQSAINTLGDVGNIATDWDEIGASILDAKGAAQKMADTQLDNLAGDITLFKSALEGAQIAISDIITGGSKDEGLRAFVNFGTKGVQQLTEAFQNGGLAGAMETFGGLLSEGLGMVVEMLPEAVDAGLQLLEALGQGLIDNAPVLFDALVQIGGMLGERLLNIMQEIADFTATFDWSNGIQTVIDGIVDFFTSDGVQKFFVLGGEILLNIGKGLIGAIPTLVSNAQQLMTGIGEGLKSGIPNILPVAMDAIMEFSGDLRKNAGKLVDSGLDMILNIADGLIKALPSLIKTVPTIVSNIAGIINDNAPKLLFAGVELIGKLLAGIVQAIPTIIAEFPKIVKAIFDVITAVNWINLGGTIIKGIVNGVKALATSLPQTLKNIGKQAVDWLKLIDWKTLGKDLIDLIVIGVKAVAQLIPNALKSIGNLAITTFKNIDWLALGTHLVEGIWAGITGSFDWITQRISEWAGSVFDWFKKVFKIGSPSKLMRDEVGKYIGQGVAVGITQSLPDVQDAIDEMTDLVETPDIEAGVNLTNSSDNILQKMNERDEYINDLASAIVDAFIKADIGVEIDNREFGRLVRKVVTA